MRTATIGQRTERVVALAGRTAERYWFVAVVVFTAVFFAMSITRAAVRPLWHDEIYTVAGATLRSIQAIWTAEHNGFDVGPPLNTIVTHSIFKVGGTGSISSRLPAMVGFWTMCLAVSAIVRRRSNAVTALGAMLLPLMTPVARYAVEARGYGLVMGLFAVAVYAWSEAARERQPRAWYLITMAAALSLAVWAHYYAALGFGAIAAAELVRWLNRRKADWPMWSALAAAVVGIVPLRVLLQASLAQSATYWRRAAWSDVFDSYGLLTGPLLGAVVVVSLGAIAFGWWGRQANDRKLDVPSYELVAAITILLLPLIAIAGGVLVINVFVPRYVLFVVVAVVVIVPLALWRLGPRTGFAEVVFTAAVILCVLYVSRDLRPGAVEFRNPVDARPILKSELGNSNPVVVTGILYLQVWYYAPPELRPRILYLGDPEAAVRIVGTDSLDRDYRSLREWYPVTVKDYAPFIKSRTPFILYSSEDLTWQPTKLREDGARLREIGRESRATVYDVTFD